MFKLKSKKNPLDRVLIAEGEREVLYQFGNLKVFAPDERFDKFVDELVKESIKQSKPNQQLEIDNNEVLLILLELLSNFNELYSELGELEIFKEMMSTPDRIKRDVKRTINAVNRLGLEELSIKAQAVNSYNKLPDDMKKNIIDSIKKSGA